MFIWFIVFFCNILKHETTWEYQLKWKMALVPCEEFFMLNIVRPENDKPNSELVYWNNWIYQYSYKEVIINTICNCLYFFSIKQLLEATTYSNDHNY